MRPAQTSQRESVVLDAFRNAKTLIVRMDNKAGGGDIVFVAPSLYVAETHKPVAMQCQDSLALAHLGCHILVRSLGDTRAALACSLADSVDDGIYILLVLGLSHKHFYVLTVYFLHIYLFFCFSYYLLIMNKCVELSPTLTWERCRGPLGLQPPCPRLPPAPR